MLTETEKLDKMQQLDLLLRHINLLLSDAEDALRVGGAEAIHQAENTTPEDFALKKIEDAREAITECVVQSFFVSKL